ncbi:MAG: hypothetical protein ABF289_12685 [Clostridiales bacterium]
MIRSLLFEKSIDEEKFNVKEKEELTDDLNLELIIKSMAKDDLFLYKTCKEVILNSLTKKELILFRQSILKDCIENKNIILELYSVITTTLKQSKKYIDYTKPHYAKVITMSNKVENGIGLIYIYVNSFEKLKKILDESKKYFSSKGLVDFNKDVDEIFTKEFFDECKYHVEYLSNVSEKKFMMVSATIGKGMKGTNYVLDKISESESYNLLSNIFNKNNKSNVINLESVNLANNANEIIDGMYTHILRVINHSAKYIQEFLESLRYEIGFYVGGINLYEEMKSKGFHTTMPVVEESIDVVLEFEDLYDLGLAIDKEKLPVRNDLNASKKNLIVITGANQGGKSTYLRSIGLAQILMQSGLFVPAEFYRSNISKRIFTHFTRKEDINMNSGRLDEELLRINNIINNMNKHSIVFMNESFATTTEREGTIIAKEIILALIEENVKVIYVTHLYEFAEKIYQENNNEATFLRAGRTDIGERTFKIKEDRPIYTSYGEDLYKKHIKENIKKT